MNVRFLSVKTRDRSGVGMDQSTLVSQSWHVGQKSQLEASEDDDQR